MSQERTTLEWARYYVEKGFSVILLIEGGGEPPEEFPWQQYQKQKPTDDL